ncbi:unnamed protein product [Brassica oleracea var. botrytis]
MFPKWDFDVEDTRAENIIKLMFVKKPWKWTMDCWEVTGTWVNTKPVVVSPAKKKVVKEDSPRPRKKARKEAPAEASEEAAAEASEEAAAEATDALRVGFGTCLTEIKYLSERVEAVEKKSESVNGTNAGRKSLAEDKDLQKEDARYLEKRDAALALYHAKSDRTRKLAASQQSPYTANNTARVIISNRKLYPGYNSFAPIDKKKLKDLVDWLKTCPHYRTALDKKPRKNDLLHIDAWINVLRKRYDANPQHFRSERMCFLDHLFAQQWRFNFKDFKDSKPDHNGLGRRLPGGAWNYYAGTIPSFSEAKKWVWGTNIDDIYAPVNFPDSHWIAMWISIPKRHIVVFDSICSSISPEELDVCASSDELRAQYSMEPFTYERPTNIPPARAVDCGANRKSMRDKMAVDIFQEHSDTHEFENKDMDDNLGAYDG